MAKRRDYEILEDIGIDGVEGARLEARIEQAERDVFSRRQKSGREAGRRRATSLAKQIAKLNALKFEDPK